MANGDWTDQENDLIVADYFAMLADDSAGRPYNKADHNRELQRRITEAADVLKQLPPVRLSGYFSTWPDILRSFGDRVGANPVPMRRPPPNPAAISRMEEAITWNRFLERDECHLMWERAEGTPWKHLCHRFGISRPTAHRRAEWTPS